MYWRCGSLPPIRPRWDRPLYRFFVYTTVTSSLIPVSFSCQALGWMELIPLLPMTYPVVAKVPHYFVDAWFTLLLFVWFRFDTYAYCRHFSVFKTFAMDPGFRCWNVVIGFFRCGPYSVSPWQIILCMYISYSVTDICIGTYLPDVALTSPIVTSVLPTA